MKDMKKIKKTAEEILSAVGGKDNIVSLTHCMSRLRFNLKDLSIPNDEEIEKIDGVLGVVRSAGQLQCVIGNDVQYVFDEINSLRGFVAEQTIDSHKSKEKRTIVTILKNILDGLSESITPILPILITASLFKMLITLFGPIMLNWIQEGDDLYTLFSFVGDAGFYFFPVLLGYTSAKKFNVTPVLGIFLGAVMLHPTFMNLAAEGASFSVLGIPCVPQSYATSLLPIIVSVWVMSYVERMFRKIIPNMFHTVFVPFLSILVMLPLTLCIIGPAGNLLGSWIGKGLVGLSNHGGLLNVFAMVIIGGGWALFVMTGMHQVLIATLVLSISMNGQDALVLPSTIANGGAVFGMCIGAYLRLKDKKEKNLALTHFLTAIVGGITEPALYGVAMKYKRPFLGIIIGGALGGLVAALTHVTCYTLFNSSNFLFVTMLLGGEKSNFVWGIIACLTGVVVSAVVTYFFGFEKDDPRVLREE